MGKPKRRDGVHPGVEYQGNGGVQPCSMIVRGKAVIADPAIEDGIIEDGAVCIHGDRIVAVGRYEHLRADYQAAREIGSSHHVVMPGLINAHDHGRGPSAFQMGIADDRLELWILELLRLPQLDPYLSVAYACATLVESGVTTVLHSFFEGSAGQYEATLAATVRAYDDSGLRAILALSILDRSWVETLLRRLWPQLGADLQFQVRGFLEGRRLGSVDEYLTVLRAWHAERQSERLRVMMGPVSVHWCSEDLLLRIWQEAQALDVGIQTHLLESRYQYQDSLARYGRSAVEYLSDLGLLSPRLSCAHCVWVTERDMDLLAASGASVVHNASSNLRLGHGIAPLNAMLASGINVALGLDSQGLNDDGDMLQEMRLVSILHRASSEDRPPTARQVLGMATLNGARALGIDEFVGTLAPGKKADLILVNLIRSETPFVDPCLDVVDRVLYRAKTLDIDTVIVNGELVMHDRQHLKLDKESLVRELKKLFEREQDDAARNLDSLVARLRPHAREFVRGQIGAHSGANRRQECTK